ncbi:secreted Ly-6/uPAR domain-containing protein 2 isoform X3 [Nomascus leucogenys]|uniref:secreted Ly-6/uPAR domain-containing protein 2 isoform X3 n=1 Tax=Nomascus leucogenys TaxID=61853 RepID=UPI00122D81B9|nr:secreted Ly-6/uPAR domain-containing protein 2 isoform X3 [Nomascus leucogenys]XP_055143434.1 secreted Ly-6/uPAR domain-containing protein 2 isoform X2 [Symphalangus syndactylus]
MQLHTGLLLAAVLSLQLAAAEAIWCHQCMGFGGCSRASRCLRDSTHCVTTATRPRTLSPHGPHSLAPGLTAAPPSSLASPYLRASAATIQHHLS